MKRLATFTAGCAFCLVVAVAIVAARQVPAAPQDQAQQPMFRSGVIVVPVDVRVLDRDGKPVTDLKESDFTVLEDNVRQSISHFSTHSFSAMTTAPGAKPAVRTRATPAIQEQTARLFLIMLGRGRLQAVSKGIDAVIHLVKDRLLPQDQVAVMAWNRATDFTNDHAKIVAMLERFKKRHEGIENSLQFQLSGLAAVYGSRAIPANLQSDIDEVFKGPGALASRQVMPEQIDDAARLTEDVRRQTDATVTAALLNDDPTRAATALDRAEAARQPLPFDAYTSVTAQSLQDLGNLYVGIEYLRTLEGEKHLVFLTEQGMYLPRAETDGTVAARANNARVAIDTIQTGGIDWGPMPTAGSGPLPPLPNPNFTAMDQFRIGTLRTLSTLTGGQFAAREYSGPALDRVDVATRFGYLIGYRPTNGRIDNRYRRIVVRVNRPGLTVLYRHGYYTNDGPPPPVDRKAYLTNRRIAGAGNYAKDVTDIGVKATASVQKKDQWTEVSLEMMVDAAHVSFKTAEDRHVATLDLAIFAGDDKERIVGQSRHTMDLKLKDETYQRYMREGIPFTITLSAVTKPTYVKVIVYDYTADLVGSTNVKIK